MGEEQPRVYRIRQNHNILNSLFFNHDKNPAHHSSMHTRLILLSLASEKGFHDDVCEKEELSEGASQEEEKANEQSWLERKLEIIGDDILESAPSVIAPGVLTQSMADNHIPPEMVITHVTTKFSYPLIVPVDRGSRKLVVSPPSESQYKDTPGVKFSFKFTTTDMYGQEVPATKVMEVVAFPSDIPAKEIFDKYVQKDFEKMSEQKKKPIHSLTHETYVSQDDDECYWSSVQNQALRRNEGISQLELLAKLPRVLSKEADTIEANPPEAYEVPKRDLGPFLRYARKEDGYGLLNGKSVEQRATELSKKMKYIYLKQTAVFDPRTSLQVGAHFDLSVDLDRYTRGVHIFKSRAVSKKGVFRKGIFFLGETSIFASQLFTDGLIKYLDKINHSVDTLERFRYKS